ncbi:MAG: hypothetical protein DCC58_05220 [Chloroflexi bacterium]|nr:MAG: hypothetical protein DCC58_05220 [Chloroflexota bacterium]
MIRHLLRSHHGGCPDDGTLRALLDGELASTTVAAHVGACRRCSERLDALRTDADWASVSVQSVYSGVAPDTQRAWYALAPRLHSAEEGTLMEVTPAPWNRGAVRLATALVAVFAVVAAFMFTPMRTVANDMLDRFRVEKFAVITIPMDLVSPFESAFLENLGEMDQSDLKARFEALGSFTTTLGMDSARQVGSLDDARASYGEFDMPDAADLPNGFTSAPQVFVTDAGSATYTLDTAEAQRIIDDLRLPIYSLPDPNQYPTLTFQLDVPAGVALLYTGGDGRIIAVAEMPSPTITFPNGLDMNMLREDILRFPGLPADIVAQLRAIDDWETTLIIPIPEGADSRDVKVNGEPGILITDPLLGSVVLWEDSGTLHFVAGQLDADALLDVANAVD